MSSVQHETENILTGLFNHFAKYLVIEREGIIQMSLWVLHTYLLEELQFSPRLIFNASQPASGKSTAQERLSALCYGSVKVGNFTNASIANFFKGKPRTLHLDEAENALDPSNGEKFKDLMGILCDGYKQGGVKLKSGKGKDGNWEAEENNMFGAVSLAGTHTPISSALATRSLVIQMRKDTEKKAQRFSERFQGNEVKELQAEVLRVVNEHRVEFENCEDVENIHYPENLDRRRIDIYSPLVRIALVAGGGWFDEIFRIMQTEANTAQAIADSGESLTRIQRLYRDIFEVIQDREGFISSIELVNQLKTHNPAEWQSYDSGYKPLNAQSLANFLHKDKIFQTRQGNLRGYHREQFEKEFKAHSLTSLGSA